MPQRAEKDESRLFISDFLRCVLDGGELLPSRHSGGSPTPLRTETVGYLQSLPGHFEYFDREYSSYSSHMLRDGVRMEIQ